MIIDTLVDEARERLDGRTVADIRIGLGYTSVLLDDGSCGMAGTVTEGGDLSCTQLSDAGELLGQPAETLSRWALSTHPVRSSVGLATINAALNRLREPGPDPLDVLAVDGAKVGMVGFFRPLVPRLRERAGELHIFERRPTSPDVLPDWAATRLLPDCDVVLITSLTLVNKTLDSLLDLARGEVGLLGPSTPMTQVLGRFGIGHLFGRVVRDADAVLAITSQAGGTQRFGRAAPKSYLRVGSG